MRFYTYITTMGYTMEAAASHHLAFYVLDRPDPLGGERIEGPMLDRDRTNFVGYFPMPVRMAMTLGEMARDVQRGKKNRMRSSRHRDAELEAPLTGLTIPGLPWVNPSPNLRSPEAGILYPGLGNFAGRRRFRGARDAAAV